MFRYFFLLATSLIVWILPRPNHGFLLFTENTVIQITVGVSVPVEMTKRGGLVFSSGFQFNFILPWNLSQFEPTMLSTRNTRELNLQDLYTSLEHILEEHGWQRGRECLLRTICELAVTPLDRSDLDVVTEIIYLLFTPSEDLSESGYSNINQINEFYLVAEKVGKHGGNCTHTYPDCIDSLLNLFTKITSS